MSNKKKSKISSTPRTIEIKRNIPARRPGILTTTKPKKVA